MPSDTELFGLIEEARLLNLSLEPDYKSLFLDEVYERCHRIDPGDELCWVSLATGWAIGKGMSPEKASEFALFICNDLG